MLSVRRFHQEETKISHSRAFAGLLRPGQRQTLRKANLKELAKRGGNLALQELEDLRRVEPAKNKAAYERFKAKRRS